MGFLDFWKKKRYKQNIENVSEIENIRDPGIVESINFPNRAIKVESCAKHSHSTNPKNYILYYEFGHLFRIMPEPDKDCHDLIGMIYDAIYIFSDGTPYNLSDIFSVKSIAVPAYEIYTPNQKYKHLGICSALEELLRMKYHDYILSKNPASQELALACLEKATQLMCYSDVKWQLESYYKVVDALNMYGNAQKADGWKQWLNKNILPVKVEEKKKQPLSYAEKERILVQRITARDMLQFTDMPYNLNCPIKKHIEPNSHALAYMDLIPENIAVAKAELQKLNVVIDCVRDKMPIIPKWARIDISRIAFQNYDQMYGYTHLICTPLTFTGKTQKIPLSLSFVSSRTQSGLGYEVNGEIRYFSSGKIASATVNCWYRHSWEKSSDGWQYILYEDNGNLSMHEILSTVKPDQYGRPSPIYKCPELLEEEQLREQDYIAYDWIQKNLPELCPKSASAFRGMKTKNSKNYQRIVEEAKKLGYIIK